MFQGIYLLLVVWTLNTMRRCQINDWITFRCFRQMRAWTDHEIPCPWLHAVDFIVMWLLCRNIMGICICEHAKRIILILGFAISNSYIRPLNDLYSVLSNVLGIGRSFPCVFVAITLFLALIIRSRGHCVARIIRSWRMRPGRISLGWWPLGKGSGQGVRCKSLGSLTDRILFLTCSGLSLCFTLPS